MPERETKSKWPPFNKSEKLWKLHNDISCLLYMGMYYIEIKAIPRGSQCYINKCNWSKYDGRVKSQNGHHVINQNKLWKQYNYILCLLYGQVEYQNKSNTKGKSNLKKTQIDHFEKW